MNENRERETGREGGSELIKGLYAAGIRPRSTPGETGLTNLSHSSSPPWDLDRTLCSIHTD